jgi:RND family efflux transporter MFP subunit
MRHTLTTVTLAAAAAAVAAAACARPEARAADAHAAEAPPTPVRVAPVESAMAAEPVRATGVVAGKDEMRLAFKIGGVVARVAADEGEAVRAGQTLALLDPAEIDAQVAKAQSAAEQAGRDLARARALYRDSVVTLAQLEQATTGARVAEADLAAARFNRRHAAIVAPAAGVVLRRLAEPSELVSPGQPVLVVRGAGAGAVLRVGLADRDAVRVRRGDAATVRFDAFPGETFAARVTEIAAAAAPGTGTYEVELALDARGRALASGLVGRAEIAVAGTARLALVPIEAVVEADGDSGTVYVVAAGADGRARARRVPVAIAFVRGAHAAVRAGLDGVASVVTDGAAYLEDGAAVVVATGTPPRQSREGGNTDAEGRRTLP